MPEPIAFTAGPQRWHVHPDLVVPGAAGPACVLLGPDGLRLPEWLAGGRHADLHPGNLLLRPGHEPTLYLVDLHAVRLGPPLTEAARRANLAVLNRWFMLRAGRTDRLRFWHAYDAARRQPVGPRHVTR